MASRSSERKQIPAAVVIAAIVVIVIALATGGWYAFNGGWKTAAMQDDEYKHERMPINAAKHGNTAALEAENRTRAARGRPLLVVPKDKKQSSPSDPAQLQQLREQLSGKGGGG